jgi:uncharacterized protein (DUF433 family)
MLNWENCPEIARHPELGGAWVFKGTRIPVESLFHNLKNGARVDDFITWFPSVAHRQIDAVLDFAEKSLA